MGGIGNVQRPLKIIPQFPLVPPFFHTLQICQLMPLSRHPFVNEFLASSEPCYQPSHFFVSTLLYWVSLFPLQLDLIRYCCHFEHLNNGFTLEALNSQLRCSFDSPSCLLLQVESIANFSLPSIVKIVQWTLEWTSIFLTKNHIRFSSNLISHKFSSVSFEEQANWAFCIL